MAENKNNNVKTPSQPVKQPTQKPDRGGYTQDSNKNNQKGHVVTSTMPPPKPKGSDK